MYIYIYIYRRSSVVEIFVDETRRTDREKALIQGGGVWFFNARDTRLYAKYGRGFSEAAAFGDRGLEAPTWEICIYQAGATNISFIICSERLICSPRRAASTCPPPGEPPAVEPPWWGPPARYPSSLSDPASSRVTRHSIPRSARRLKLIPNNACKSLGKCTSRVKTAPPSAGNGGHSIFVQRCFRRWRGHAVAKGSRLSAPALTIRDYQAGSFRRLLRASAMRALFLYEMDVCTLLIFFLFFFCFRRRMVLHLGAVFYILP